MTQHMEPASLVPASFFRTTPGLMPSFRLGSGSSGLLMWTNFVRKSTEQFFVPFVTTDYRELLHRDDVDVVSICTPPSLHERMVIDALEAGKYVLCEKPLAHNLAAADRILEAANRFPNRLSVVYQLRFSPEALRTRWLIEQGHFGRLQFASFVRVRAIPHQHRSGLGSWWGKWDVAGGGALITQCIHELDLALYFLGPAKRVTAAMATISSPIESEDTVAATIEHESGAVIDRVFFGTLRSFSCPNSDPGQRISGPISVGHEHYGSPQAHPARAGGP